MNNNTKVYCKQNCKSMGGAIFEKDHYYDCKVLNNTYILFDKNNTILRLEDNSLYPEHNQFKDYFYTEKQYRKEKLEKIYETTSRNKS